MSVLELIEPCRAGDLPHFLRGYLPLCQMPYGSISVLEGGTAWPNWSGTPWPVLDTPPQTAPLELLYPPPATRAASICYYLDTHRPWRGEFESLKSTTACTATKKMDVERKQFATLGWALLFGGAAFTTILVGISGLGPWKPEVAENGESTTVSVMEKPQVNLTRMTLVEPLDQSDSEVEITTSYGVFEFPPRTKGVVNNQVVLKDGGVFDSLVTLCTLVPGESISFVFVDRDNGGGPQNSRVGEVTFTWKAGAGQVEVQYPKTRRDANGKQTEEWVTQMVDIGGAPVSLEIVGGWNMSKGKGGGPGKLKLEFTIV